jgi:hypothetical protein
MRRERLFWWLVGGLVAYELLALVNNRKHETISSIIRRYTTDRPMLPFAGGLLCGHFWWR